jgi:hypothetical protein
MLMTILVNFIAIAFFTLFIVATVIHCFYVLRDGGRNKK